MSIKYDDQTFNERRSLIIIQNTWKASFNLCPRCILYILIIYVSSSSIYICTMVNEMLRPKIYDIFIDRSKSKANEEQMYCIETFFLRDVPFIYITHKKSLEQASKRTCQWHNIKCWRHLLISKTREMCKFKKKKETKCCSQKYAYFIQCRKVYSRLERR